MYEELVKKLRRCGKGICTEDCPDWTKENLYHTCQDEVTLEAADAIDELDTLLDGLEADNDALCEIIEKLKKPRWVSVKERMPDAYVEVLLQFPNNQAVGFCDRDGCWGVFSGDGFYTEVADNEPKPTHWAKKLPEPTKETIDWPHPVTYTMFKGTEACPLTNPQPKRTHGDDLRAMTDEELAEFLAEYRCAHKAPHCMEANCAQCWLEWLRQEAEEGAGTT